MKCDNCERVSHGKTYTETPVDLVTDWEGDSNWSYCPWCGQEQ